MRECSILRNQSVQNPNIQHSGSCVQCYQTVPVTPHAPSSDTNQLAAINGKANQATETTAYQHWKSPHYYAIG
jgi:hypothetical protein